ncbi:MAG: prepilin-type N-terminal cleavage/methylation domain-containing protein [Patescibacteria group bacterium]|nr:prepilin-type N-terminal cleavage/methylation domain-containing protein [bacterium]MDZ4240903.1 prepilin-type N-terminal cleavage/methylation domain-containing protein [Patescibacteria group bacterium]
MKISQFFQQRGFTHQNFQKRVSSGFTLTELLVSIAIMTFVIGVVLFNYRSYDENILADKFANEIILTLREAQVYATSVKEIQPGSDDFSGWYGIFFTDNSTEYLIFNDANQDGQYDTGEELQTYDTQSGLLNVFFTEVLGFPQTAPSVTVTFPRSLSPQIEASVAGVNPIGASFEIYSPRGEARRLVCVWESGRMYITRSADCE